MKSACFLAQEWMGAGGQLALKKRDMSLNSPSIAEDE